MGSGGCILDVRKSVVLDSAVIDSPVMGKIAPTLFRAAWKHWFLWKMNVLGYLTQLLAVIIVQNGFWSFLKQIISRSISGTWWILERICLISALWIRIRYDFEIKRNITAIRGDSATGKTALVDMIREYYENGNASAIELICDKECTALEGRTWAGQFSMMRECIVFIDEGNDFVMSKEFADTIQNTDN